MGSIKRVDRQLAYKGSILDIYTDTMVTDDGHTTHFDHIHHPGAVGIIPVLDDGRLLMVRQFRNSLDEDTLEIPAGGIEAGEELMTAALRELEEETGYKADSAKEFIKIATAVAFCNEIVTIFIADNLIKSEQHLDPEEFINVEAYTTDELSRMIFAGKIKDSKTVAAVMAYIEYIRHTL